MYKYSLNILPPAITDLFTINEDIHDHNTRQKHLLRHPIGTREYMYKSFSFNAVYIWNYITTKTNLNTSAPLSIFKKSLKNYLLHNDIVIRVV